MNLEAALAQLARKYAALIDLRLQREALEARGVLRLEGAQAQARRAQTQALAREFPGALRELECRDSAALQRCWEEVLAERAALKTHPRRRLPQRRWIRMALAFHAALREGLAIRHWLAMHRGLALDAESDLVPLFLSWYQHCSVRQQPLSQVNVAWLRRYAKPPEGRLTTLVWQELAAHYGCTPRTVRRQVLGVE